MDTEERNRLVEANIGLVGYVLNKFFPGFSKNQDMYQDGCIELIEKAAEYRPERGSFSNFACTCIRNRFRRYLKGDRRQEVFEREQRIMPATLDKEDRPPGEHDVNADRAVFEALLGLCRSPRASEVMALKMQGLSLKAIGDRLGFTRERARQIYEEGLCAMRNPKAIDQARGQYERTGKIQPIQKPKRPSGTSPSAIKRNSRVARGLCPQCAQSHLSEFYYCDLCRLKSKQRRQK